jgi:Protein of unknown function (DUF3137)
MNPKQPPSQQSSARPGVYKRLRPVVRWLKQDRQAVQRRTLIAMLLVAFLSTILTWLVWVLAAPAFVYACLLTLALLAVRGVQVRSSAATSQSKAQILARFAQALGSRFVALPNDGINQTDFVSSRLFTQALRSYHSAHHLRGKVGSVRLELSEVRAEGATEDHLFNGVWIMATFQHRLRATLLLRPISDDLEFAQCGFKSLKLEETVLAHSFHAFTEDALEAQYVLSSRLCTRINDFLQAFGHEMHFSWHDRCLQIGIQQPDLPGPEFAQALQEVLTFVVGLVRELEANSYIWHKALTEPRSVGPEILEFALRTTQERTASASRDRHKGKSFAADQFRSDQFGPDQFELGHFTTDRVGTAND